MPTYHWSNDYVQQLSLRFREIGITLDHLPLSPAKMAQLADSSSARAATAAERFWIERLIEFTSVPTERHVWMQMGTRMIEKAGDFGNDLRSRTNMRSQVGIFPDEHVSLVNVIRVDDELGDDPNYLGKRWRGITGFTEQAYVQLHFDKYLLKFGRDFVWWGRGYDATLLLSDSSRPLDHFLAQLNLRRLRFTYLTAKLNSVALPHTMALFYAPGIAERYLAAARAEIKVMPRALTVAATQMTLYGGPGRGFEWNYLNPFLVFHGEQLNEKSTANTFGAVDFIARPVDRLEVYGQLLIDDIQVEKTGSGDLEPNEIGYMLGGVIADPLSLHGTSFGLEYTRVANRTYNTANNWEKFMHRNQLLAHFLGNDFDRWVVYSNLYLGRNFQTSLALDLRRHGEGRVEGKFDTPWQDYDVDEGYHEPFPSGVVEYNTNFRFELAWHPANGFHVALLGEHSRYSNFENRQNVSRNDTSLLLRLWWEKLWWLKLEP